MCVCVCVCCFALLNITISGCEGEVAAYGGEKKSHLDTAFVRHSAYPCRRLAHFCQNVIFSPPFVAETITLSFRLMMCVYCECVCVCVRAALCPPTCHSAGFQSCVKRQVTVTQVSSSR